MSTGARSKHSSRRHIDEVSCNQQSKMDLDLNAYPDGTSPSVSLEETQDSATPGNVVQLDNAPIDVDAIDNDDEVTILSSPIEFLQARHRSRNSVTEMVILDDYRDSDVLPGPSGAALKEPETRLALSSYSYEMNPPARDIINVEVDGKSESSDSVKDMQVEDKKGSQVVVQPEPSLSCPVCWSEMVDETSTTCGHIFCEKCITQAIKAYKRCPTCMKSLTMRKIHRIYLPGSHTEM